MKYRCLTFSSSFPLDRLFIFFITLICLGCEKLTLVEQPFVGKVSEGENMVSIEEATGKVFARSFFFHTQEEDITQFGHIWAEEGNNNPEPADRTIFSPEGALPDSFTSQIIRLDGNKAYYVRPYFIDAEGETFFGEVESFTTPFESFIDMVFVEGGSKLLGAANGEVGSDDERPAEEITISSYNMGRYEVNQNFYFAVMGSNPSQNEGRSLREPCGKCPVENVSWFEAVTFTEKLSQMTGRSFRLPTEAEWEFAARGGLKQSKRLFFSGSDTLATVGWHKGNSGIGSFGNQSHEVGLLKPNSLGIYDMTGNVIEWCSDWYDFFYYNSPDRPKVDPQGPAQGRPTTLVTGETVVSKVSRSCSFLEPDDFQLFCRISNRNPFYPPNSRNERLGFRIAETLK